MPISPPFNRLPARALLPSAAVMGIVLILIARLHPASRALVETSMGAGLLAYAGVVVVLLVAARNARLDWNRLLGPTLPHTEWPLAAVAFPLAALSYAGFWLLWVPLSLIAPGFVQSYALDTMPELLSRGNPARLFLDVVVIVIVAPVVEEILFRGILLHRWAARWGTTAGVIVSSALFAIGHVELIGHFVFGVALAALYVRTRSLWVPIAAHVVNNAFAISFAIPDALRGVPEIAPSIEEFREEWPAAVLFLVLGATVLWWLWRRYGPRGAWTLPYASEAQPAAAVVRPGAEPIDATFGEAP
ncbi:MAG: CPBP family intramembrane metalloprotease [Cytophagaceae bacterium]|nr:CPBP family intramembrane metalloprotease [Gemmatimonadaceae bacterium]